jgi:large subunit ribosomal protein L32
MGPFLMFASADTRNGHDIRTGPKDTRDRGVPCPGRKANDPVRSENGPEHERNCIMPNPKRRHSSRRTANRRAHDFLSASGLSECPNCHEKKLPHRACPKCGEYKGRAVVETKESVK